MSKPHDKTLPQENYQYFDHLDTSSLRIQKEDLPPPGDDSNRRQSHDRVFWRRKSHRKTILVSTSDESITEEVPYSDKGAITATSSHIKKRSPNRKERQLLIEEKIEKETKLLLDLVNNTIHLMEKMIIGISALDNNRFEEINNELESIYKSALHEDTKGEELNKFHIKEFIYRFRNIESEIREIYISWMHQYSTYFQEMTNHCQTLSTLLNEINKRNKRQKVLLNSVLEFSSYTAAQKISIYRLLQESYDFLPQVQNTVDVIHNVALLKERLNAPLPVSFGNLVRSSKIMFGKKKKKKETDKNKSTLRKETNEIGKKHKAKDKAITEDQTSGTKETKKVGKKDKAKDKAITEDQASETTSSQVEEINVSERNEKEKEDPR